MKTSGDQRREIAKLHIQLSWVPCAQLRTGADDPAFHETSMIDHPRSRGVLDPLRGNDEVA